MAVRNAIKVYVVRRLGWEYGDDFYYRNEGDDAPLETFLDPNKAEEKRRQLHWEYVSKQRINPFGWVDAGLAERSSLPLEQLLHRLHQAGLRFDEGGAERADLWQQYDGMPAEQQKLVWEAVDQIRFFELVEMTVDLEG